VLSGLPDVELTCIDNRGDRLGEAGTHFPTARLASSLTEVEDDLDAVIIATPPRSHSEVALRALRAGLHTLVEKPLATSVADAEAIVEAADQAALTLMVGHTFAYNSAVRMLKDIVRSGELGRILYVDTARLNLGIYQADCNVIWDLAPHDISILTYLLDETPDTITVWAQRTVGGLQEDVAYVRLDFPSAPAYVRLSWLDPNKIRKVTVVGERKMAVYDDLSDTRRIQIYDRGVNLCPIGDGPAPPMPISYRTGDITSPYVEFVEPLRVQDSHFIDCVRNGSRPQTSGAQGLEIVRVLAASDESIATGAPARIRGYGMGVPARSLSGLEVSS